MILKLDMQVWNLKFYQVYISDDPGLTQALPILRHVQIWSAIYVYLGKLLPSLAMGKT